MNFDQITLKNGLRIIGERIPHFRSVSVGFWVGSGSQYETPDEAGLLGCFRTDDPLSVEALGELTGLNPGELATLLVGLELAGAVRQLPGNRYMKL